MVTDEMVEAGCKANFKWYLGEWITEDQRDIARQQVRTILEAALSAAEPVATVAEMGSGGMRVLMPHPSGSADHLPIGTKLYAAPPALSAQVQDVAGWQLVPKDDESRCVADSALPHEMIEAGILVQEQVNDDHCNYVAGETTDWDCGMVAVAIYRAMLAAAPAKQ